MARMSPLSEQFMDDTSGWQFGIHLRTKIAKRSVSVEWLIETLDKPDEVRASGHRKVYQKRFGDMLRIALPLLFHEHAR